MSRLSALQAVTPESEAVAAIVNNTLVQQLVRPVLISGLVTCLFLFLSPHPCLFIFFFLPSPSLQLHLYISPTHLDPTYTPRPHLIPGPHLTPGPHLPP